MKPIKELEKALASSAKPEGLKDELKRMMGELFPWW